MSNRLQFESSPYLLQHAHNPVDWYPWDAEAFQKAASENKPVLVSIGYAACHWCHVMERESFEDPAVAAFMNEHFVCVKVDREEHPDVDHLYMDALQAMSGAGGWPLNMFVTPDRKPFYGGTYFPPRSMYGRSSWMEVLGALHRAWHEQPDAIAQQSDQMLQHLRQASLVAAPQGPEGKAAEQVRQAVVNLLKQADTEEGGFGKAPKFPASGAIRFLLEYDHFNKESNAAQAAEALQQALLSLDKMAGGGIYDQIGGGFARYATDNEWLVPHFEKMLYDNALLLSALAHACRMTGKEAYRETMLQTIGFCNRELKQADMPGFFCALDADSEGVEGKFYTWTWEDWRSLLPAIHPAVTAYLGVTEAGNWEEVNILHQALPQATLLQQYALTEEDWRRIWAGACRQLLEEREKRIRPATDDKILLSWNALVNIALVDTAAALDAATLLSDACMHMDWLLSVFPMADGGYFHVYKEGRARIPGKLDDYAYLIGALRRLAAVTGRSSYLEEALALMQYTERHFLSEDRNFYYFSADYQDDIPVRKVELYDGATPSANALMQENLWVLGNLIEESAWLEQSEAMLAAMAQNVMRYPSSFSCWALQLQRMAEGPKQLLICGPDAVPLLKEWTKRYHPEVNAMAFPDKDTAPAAVKSKFREGATLFYLCEHLSCKAPVASIEAVAAMLEKRS